MTWYIYDYFNYSPGNQHWRSQAGGAPPDAVRSAVEYMRKKVGTIRCNTWQPEDYIGGFHAAGGNAAVWRVYNGGRDDSGRPHRWVLLLLAAPVRQFRKFDFIELLQQTPFAGYGLVSVPSEPSFPKSLPSLEFRGSPAPYDPQGSFQDAGPEAVTRARSAFGQLVNGEREGTLVIESIGGARRVWCEMEPIPGPATVRVAEAEVAAAEPAGDPLQRGPRQPEGSTAFGPRLPQTKWLVTAALLGLVFILFILLNRPGRREHSFSTPESVARDLPRDPLTPSPPGLRSNDRPPEMERMRPLENESTAPRSNTVEQLSPAELQVASQMIKIIEENTRGAAVTLKHGRVQGKTVVFDVEPGPAQEDNSPRNKGMRREERNPQDLPNWSDFWPPFFRR